MLVGLSLEEISRSRPQPFPGLSSVSRWVEENIYDLKVLVLLCSLTALIAGYFIPGPVQYKIVILYGILLGASILFTLKNISSLLTYTNGKFKWKELLPSG